MLLGTFLLSIFVVTNASDDVNGTVFAPGPDGLSLREAALASNFLPGPHTIRFDPSIATTPIHITERLHLLSPGLTIEGPAAIDVGGQPLGVVVHASSITLRGIRFTGMQSGTGALRIAAEFGIPEVLATRIEGCEFAGDPNKASPLVIAIGAGFGGHVADVQIRGCRFRDIAKGGDAVRIGFDGDFALIENVVIEGNTFAHNASAVALAFGAHQCSTRDVTIRGNQFGDNQQTISIGNGTAASTACVIERTTIEKNLVIGNANGIAITVGETGLNRVTNARIVNNVISGNETGISITGDVGAQIINNTIVNNRGAGVTIAQNSSAGVVNNIIWNNMPNIDAGGDQLVVFNLTADPLFADPANGNWYLRDGSPAIDAGTIIDAPPTDMFGSPRCGPPDLGAIEHCATVRRRVGR